jgi:hypothetical protein
MMRKMAVVAGCAIFGLAAALAMSGCFLNRWPVRASAPETPEAAESAAKAVPASGAGASIAAVGDTLQALGSATLNESLIDRLDPVFTGGVWFMVIGGAAYALVSKGIGGSLFLMGGAMVLSGILFGQYPWVTLIVFVAVGCVVLYEALTVKDTKDKLEGTVQAAETIVEAIQTTPEGKAIKEAIAGKGTPVERLVRAVVDPIKDKLNAAGKI